MLEYEADAYLLNIVSLFVVNDEALCEFWDIFAPCLLHVYNIYVHTLFAPFLHHVYTIFICLSFTANLFQLIKARVYMFPLKCYTGSNLSNNSMKIWNINQLLCHYQLKLKLSWSVTKVDSWEWSLNPFFSVQGLMYFPAFFYFS